MESTPAPPHHDQQQQQQQDPQHTRPTIPLRNKSQENPRPKTAPSSSVGSIQAESSISPTSSHFNIPKIAIFKDAFSLQNLRKRAERLTSISHASSRAPASSSHYTSDSETRPPSLKRSPASRSSNGVETSLGPPPALITRKSYNSDLAHMVKSPATIALIQQKHKPYNFKSSATDSPPTRQDSFLESSSPDFDVASSPLSPKLHNDNFSQSFDAIMGSPSLTTPTHDYQDDGASGYTDGRSPVQDGPSSGGTENSGRSAEDLFLNLAEDTTADSRAYETQSRLGRRLVRLLLLLLLYPETSDHARSLVKSC